MTSAEFQAQLDRYIERFRRKKWSIIIIMAVIFGLIVLWRVTTPIAYEGRTTFHPVQTGSEGFLNPIASFFEGELSMVNGEMIGILSSRNVSERVAADTILYDKRRMPIAEAYYIAADKHKGLFTKISGIFQAKDTAKRSLNKMVTKVGRSFRKQVIISENEYSFLVMAFSHPDYQLVGEVLKSYMHNLEIYYFEQKTEKARTDLLYYTTQRKVIEQKLDSVQGRVAALQDYQRYGNRSAQSIPLMRAKTKALSLESQLQRWISSEAQAQAQLQSNTPMVQVLDPPAPPFGPRKPSIKIKVIAGFLLGCMLAAFLFFRDLIWEDISTYFRYVVVKGLDD